MLIIQHTTHPGICVFAIGVLIQISWIPLYAWYRYWAYTGFWLCEAGKDGGNPRPAPVIIQHLMNVSFEVYNVRIMAKNLVVLFLLYLWGARLKLCEGVERSTRFGVSKDGLINATDERQQGCYELINSEFIWVMNFFLSLEFFVCPWCVNLFLPWAALLWWRHWGGSTSKSLSFALGMLWPEIWESPRMEVKVFSHRHSHPFLIFYVCVY